MEEQVGELWHKLLYKITDKTYPEQKVQLKNVKARLLIFFRALNQDNALSIELADKRRLKTKRNWLQKLAGTNRFAIACWRDEETLYLPAEIAFFEQQQLNEDLYFWLAGLASQWLEPGKLNAENWLQYNQILSRQTLEKFPGLGKKYRQLVAAHIRNRPDLDSLNKQQTGLEENIRHALLSPEKLQQLPESRYLPAHVPLWLYQPQNPKTETSSRDDDNNSQRNKKQKDVDDMARKKARRVDSPEETRGLITVRMENIFTWGEHAAVDRSTDDEDDLDLAEDAARDMDEIAVTHNQRAAASRLKFDLDLPSAAEDEQPISEGIMLPEWNYKKAELQDDWCRIVELQAINPEHCELPTHLRQTAKKLKNQFQALAPARHWNSGQQDGQEIDIDRWLRFTCDRRVGKVSADQLYRELLSGNRDMCCTLLADLSLSTDSWIDNDHRIIDVIRDTLLLFGESLQATGDQFSITGFSSRKRDPVRIHLLKRFSDAFNGITRGRINAIKPGYYTRMGAAIRYCTSILAKQPQHYRLLLILTDGKPNDLDQYEGRYGIEDTRQAILEARRLGLQPFCVTIDSKGNEYLPYVFGSNSYIVIKNPTELPRRLPLLYAQLTGQ